MTHSCGSLAFNFGSFHHLHRGMRDLAIPPGSRHGSWAQNALGQIFGARLGGSGKAYQFGIPGDFRNMTIWIPGLVALVGVLRGGLLSETCRVAGCIHTLNIKVTYGHICVAPLNTITVIKRVCFLALLWPL